MEKIIETELSLEDILKVQLTNEDIVTVSDLDGKEHFNILNLILENLASSCPRFLELEEEYFSKDEMFSFLIKHKIIEDCKLKIQIFDITNEHNCPGAEEAND